MKYRLYWKVNGDAFWVEANRADSIVRCYNAVVSSELPGFINVQINSGCSNNPIELARKLIELGIPVDKIGDWQ